MDERFLHAEMLLGPQAMGHLTAAHVAVFGLGDVGSWCVEALVRSGVGVLTLVDYDMVGLTNLNRQMEAIRSALGQSKTQAMTDRIRNINPDCRPTIRAEKYEARRWEDSFGQPLDYVADCVDLVSCKLDLIETALTWGVPIVSSLGTGNKLDPGLFHIIDLLKTEGCSLTRMVRRELHAHGTLHHRVLWSPEELKTALQREAPPSGRHSVPDSVTWVPPAAGLILVGEVVLSLVGLHV